MDLHRNAGIYLHIPFCQKKCSYCNFFSEPVTPVAQQAFLQALRTEVSLMAALPAVQQLTFSTLFLGGGTPTVLPSNELADLIQSCRQIFFQHTTEIEITVEVNPGTIDYQGLQKLAHSGVSRLSIGVQSFSDQELVTLGRIHTAQQAENIIQMARQCGFHDLNIDLMYGLPGQRIQDWQASLEQALSYAPTHLSLYELTLEPGTPFWNLWQQNQLAIPEETTILSMMEYTQQRIERAGLQRYEISNYALPGRACRHNLNYWRNGHYLGLGPAAVSFLQGKRKKNTENIDHYVQGIIQRQPQFDEEEFLDTETAFRETVIMGLRMIQGVSLEALAQRFALDPLEYYGEILQTLLAQNLLTISSGYLALTAQGLPLANYVYRELV